MTQHDEDDEDGDHKVHLRIRLLTMETFPSSTPPETAVILELACEKCKDVLQMKVAAHHVRTLVRELEALADSRPELFEELPPEKPALKKGRQVM